MMKHLCFHGVGRCLTEREPGEARYWVTRDLFLSVLDEVHGRPDIRISFDDGNASDVEIALPALIERGMTATFFPLAGRLQDPASLSSTDLVTLRGAGMDIGTHGWAHIPWRRLSAAQVQRELVDARRDLVNASGGPVDEAALPLGRYDRTLLGHLHHHGYRRVYSSDRFPARPDTWLQARYSLTAGDSLDSVRGIFRPGLPELRQAAVSVVKRWR